ncbi:MAG: error-prone DNA polymerase [Pseudomonadota bacterium]
MPAYAELQVTTNFTFLEGTSHPEELVLRAADLGLQALAVTDRNSFAGLVRAHVTAKQMGLRYLPGVRLDFRSGRSLLAWPSDRPAYARLAKLITKGRRRAPKGECYLEPDDLYTDAADGVVVAALAPTSTDADFAEWLHELRSIFSERTHLAASCRFDGRDRPRLERLAVLARTNGCRLLATNDVVYHDPARRPLQDVVTCIREHVTLDQAGSRLLANAERHLKPAAEMARLFQTHPDALQAGLDVVAACRFSLDELAYDYPIADGYDGRTPQEELERRTFEGARERYPEGLPAPVETQLRHELQLIGELNYAPYFLTVDDVVRFARSRDILCQGRGSAANSVVCYCLGVTAIDPVRTDLLFERFVSAARNEPPDIDVDFEHERREEVIQHVYDTYGREHAGLAATVIRYRARSAIREVGKVVGLSFDTVDALARTVWGWSSEGLEPAKLKDSGLDVADSTIAMAIRLAKELIGFPRHLSQHVGGFVIAKSPLDELVPIENAAMKKRTVVEWDKDDLDALNMLKIDVLALGMLSCIRRAFDLLRVHKSVDLELATVPPEDPLTYAMISNADTIGVFQIESRAQMSMLPRLRPKTFYDLVIEVAIVRPGPIQGDMVHPYLRRRNGEEPVDYPSKDLEQVLGKTEGVPIFQEQAMKIAMVAGGFTASEADELRRSMASFRKNGELEQFHTKLVGGMVERGYQRDFAERCFKQIEGFGYYGFPESHAASFALLVYVSAWLKCHHPDVFAAALLNAQPMGFYGPGQIVRDAREHRVEVRPVDVNHSRWDNTLERRAPALAGPKHALRLGFRQVKGLREKAMDRLVKARTRGPFRDPADLQRRAELEVATLERLAEADAFGSLGLDRRHALWAVKALKTHTLPLFDHAELSASEGSNHPPLHPEPRVELPPMPIGEAVVEDYTWLKLSLKAHPCGVLRPVLSTEGFSTCGAIQRASDRAPFTTAGLVLIRQRPGSAKGVVFSTLEDETGIVNLVIWPKLMERYRPVIMAARLLGARGQVQRQGQVIHLVAHQLVDLTDRLELLTADTEAAYTALDQAMSPVDEAKRPVGDKRAGKAMADERLRHTFEQSAARTDAAKKPAPETRSERRLKDTAPKAEDAMPKGRNFR